MERLIENAELIVEQLLGITEEISTGIYMKQLDSGRQVFTCKCSCGALHGGYRTRGEAEAHKKCKMCYRKEIERTRKELEKVDEPKKQKNIFQHAINKPAVIGEGEDDFENDSWKEVTDVLPDYIAYQVHDGKEYYPVSRDGLIGRRGWNMSQLSGQWKIVGISFDRSKRMSTTWAGIRMRLDNDERVFGYLWDRDHGTLRRWGQKAQVYKLSVNENNMYLTSR